MPGAIRAIRSVTRVISPGRGLDPYRRYVLKGNPGNCRPSREAGDVAAHHETDLLPEEAGFEPSLALKRTVNLSEE